MNNQNHYLEELLREKHGNKTILFKTMVVICGWNKSISVKNQKIMIARALNEMVHFGADIGKPKKLEIIGYLITKRRIFLILKGREKEIHEKLTLFESHIREKLQDKNYRLGNLFKYYGLFNESLEYLLTGRKPDLKYDSPHMVRFWQQVKVNPFCSALDYSGAQSMVWVSVKQAQFWKQMEKQKRRQPIENSI